MNVLLDVAVESWRDIVRFVRSLDLLDPDVKHAELLINETFKIVRFLKHIIDAAHEEGEETETDKLKENDSHFIFLTSKIIQKMCS